MHEFSVASQIWSSVLRAASAHGTPRVRSIKLEIGALNLILEDQLTFWLEMLAERDGSPGVKVNITLLAARLRCNQCGAEGEAALAPGEMEHFLPPLLACEACGSSDVAVTGGRELRVVSAEIDKAGAGER